MISNLRSKKVILVFLLFCILAGLLVLQLFKQSHKVVYTNQGFLTPSLTVRQGEKVTFVNKSGRDFWPASNSHPSHDIYPEFDPGKPLPSGTEWSFVFNKSGVWKYHDHLHSDQGGVVYVSGKDSSFVVSSLNEACAKGMAKKEQCWEEDIRQSLVSGGLEAAFDTLEKLYNSETGFSASCHNYTHLLGEEAYKIYSNGGSLKLTNKASYCGYGFYHGFVEALLFSSGNISEARDFCDNVKNGIANASPKNTIACYHGIGHGIVDGSDKTLWGDTKKFISKGLSLCSALHATPKETELCATGVYNSLAIALNAGLYELPQNTEDPYADCHEQSVEEFKVACYEEMNTRAMALAKGEFSRAVEYVGLVPQERYAVVAVQNLASAAASFMKPADYAKSAKVCMAQKAVLKEPCVNGVMGGLFEFGKPNFEYEPSALFCALPVLGEAIGDNCFKNLVSTVKFIYPESKAREVCGLLGAKAEKYCFFHKL